MVSARGNLLSTKAEDNEGRPSEIKGEKKLLKNKRMRYSKAVDPGSGKGLSDSC